MSVRGDFGKLAQLSSGMGRLGKSGRQEVLQLFASALNRRTDMCFQQSVSPYGETWPPLKATSGRRKGGMPLLDTGRLRNSVVGATARPGGVTVASNVVYAASHNYGRDFIPKRQFLPDEARGLPPLYVGDLNRATEAVIRRALGEGAP